MKNRKLSLLLCSALVGAVLLSGCGAKETPATEARTTEVVTEAPTETQTTEAVTEAATEATTEASAQTAGVISDSTVAGWHIVVEQTQSDKSLENVSVALGYTGVETTDYVKEASEGNMFCLVKLLIEKQKSTEVIDWENFTLTDGDGNVYNRLDDEFLVDLGMKRMPGTKLNFGSNEGWIAFEVKESASDFQLNYAFKEETFTSPLS